MISDHGELNPRPEQADRSVPSISQNIQSLKKQDLKHQIQRSGTAELLRGAHNETWLNDGVESSELESALPTHDLLDETGPAESEAE